MMDTDLSVTTSAAEPDSDLGDLVEASYDEVQFGIGMDVYKEGMEDFSFVNLDEQQPVDETLSRTWDLLHAKDEVKAVNDPALPWHDKPGTSWDEIFERESDWRDMPQGERQSIAAAAKSTDELRDAAKKYFGLDIKTPADVMAIRRAMDKGIDGDAAPAPVFNDLGIQAKSNSEAIQHLQSKVQMIRTDPYNGWRKVLADSGINPAWLVQQHEYGQPVPPQYQHLVPQQQGFPPQQQHQPHDTSSAAMAVVNAWAADRPDLDDATEREMAALLKQKNFAPRTGPLKRLEKAYQTVRRRNGRKSYRQRSDEALDATLASSAEEIFD